MRAYLIGEKTAGMTAVEIYDRGGLVWSMKWLGQGASDPGYSQEMVETWETLHHCAEYADFGPGDLDDVGNPVPYDVGPHTGWILAIDGNGKWHTGALDLGQGTEIMAGLILAGLIENPGLDMDYWGSRNATRAVAEAARAMAMAA